MGWQRGLTPLLGAVFATLMSGCGGSRSAPVTPAAVPAAPLVSSNAPLGFGYDAALVRSAQLLGPANFGALSVGVGLPLHNAAALRQYATSVSLPGSGNYRHFLDAAEIGDRFGASASDETRAIAYFKKFHLRVSGWRQRMLLTVSGTQAELEAAFHTKFGTFQSTTGQSFIAPMSAPSVDAGVPVTGSDDIVFRPEGRIPQFIISHGNQFGFSPQQIAAAFDYNGAYAAGFTGAGITVGVISAGPILTSSGGHIGDAEAYKALYHVAGSSGVTIVPTTSSDPVVDGASGFAPPLPVTAPCTTSGAPGLPPGISPVPSCNPEDPNNAEPQIDVEQAAALARDSSVEFYWAYNPNDDCTPETIGQPCPAGAGIPLQGIAETEEEVQTAIDHGTADVLSLSFGEAEIEGVGGDFNADGSGLEPTAFAMLAAEGVAVFVSSGDGGAEACLGQVETQENDLCVEYPATDPNVVAVGGVTTPLNSAGQLIGPIAAWGLQSSNGFGGTGGGVSAYFSQPVWQQGAPGVVGGTRNIPDVALEGDPSTGVSVVTYGDPSFAARTIQVIGGTSVAAPEMAAMWALVLQACKQTASCVAKGSGSHPYRLGNPAPMFYGFYKNAATIYTSTFLSETYGNNSQAEYCFQLSQTGGSDPVDCPPGGPSPPPVLDPGFSANPNGGYNQLTGLGVPFARALIRAVVGI